MVAARYDLSDLKSQVDVRDIARHYLDPKLTRPKYDQYLAPDRPEKQASFTVYADGFKDFGDGTHGDVIDLIKRLENCDTARAWERLREYAGELPARPVTRRAQIAHAAEPPAQDWQRTARQLVAADERRLWSDEGRPALEYLHRRGLTDDTIRAARLGYNPVWHDTAYIQDGQPARMPPGITIPWFVGGALWAIKVRALSPDSSWRYNQLAGGKQAVILGADDIRTDLPNIWLGGEFKRLIALQQAPGLANYLTTGSESNPIPERFKPSINGAKNILIRDNDPTGETNADKNILGLPAHRIVVTVPQDLGAAKAIDDYAALGGDVRAFILDCLSLPTISIVISDNGKKQAGPEPAPVDKSRIFYNPIGEGLKSLSSLLCSDESDRALDQIPHEERSRATEYRRKSRTNLHSINTSPDQESETNEIMPKDVVINHATPDLQSQIQLNRLRILFPQSDPVTALIPVGELTPALFADELTEQDITGLRDHAALRTLTAKQRQAVRARLRVLRKVETLQKQLDKIPFELPDRPIKNLPDLRAHVLRQICQRFADPVTGKSKLSNLVQALLIGVTPGALPGIRARACIEQIAPEEVQHEHTNATRLPGNTRYVKIRDDQGNVKAYHRATDPGIYDTIAQALRDGYQVFTILQPIAEQRVLPLTAPAPKEHAVKVDPGDNSTNVETKDASSDNPKIAKPPRRRRAPRERYAGLLMRNILHYLGIERTGDEPLDELAAYLRRAIAPTWIELSDPDRDVADQQPEPPAVETVEHAQQKPEHRQTVADILNDLQAAKELAEQLKRVTA